jgi:hypothetical protein
MKKKTTMLLVISSALLLSSCFKEEWEGFVYPNKNDLTAHRNIGVYESLESCRAASHDMLSRISSINKGDYECGLNCEYRSDMGSIKICERTER